MAQTQPESKAWKNMWRSTIRVRGFNGFAEPAALELSRKTWRISKGQRGGRRGLLPQPLKKAHVLAKPNMPNKINQYVDPVWWLCNMSSVHGIHAKTIPKKLVIFIFTMHSTSNQLCAGPGVGALEWPVCIIFGNLFLGVFATCLALERHSDCRSSTIKQRQKEWLQLQLPIQQYVTLSHPHDNYHQVPQLSFSSPSLRFLVELTPS